MFVTRRAAATAAVLPAHTKVTVDVANRKKERDRHEHTDDKGRHRNPPSAHTTKFFHQKPSIRPI